MVYAFIWTDSHFSSCSGVKCCMTDDHNSCKNGCLCTTLSLNKSVIITIWDSSGINAEQDVQEVLSIKVKRAMDKKLFPPVLQGNMTPIRQLLISVCSFQTIQLIKSNLPT